MFFELPGVISADNAIKTSGVQLVLFTEGKVTDACFVCLGIFGDQLII